GAMISVFEADDDKQLTVTGRLEVPDKSQKKELRQFIQKIEKAVPISITNVQRVSYGQDAEGSVIWVEGRAGWFNIKPARSYRSIYADMQEAVMLYYYIIDTYVDGQKCSAKRLISNIAKYAWDQPKSEEEAAGIVYGHRQFFAKQMLQGPEREAVQWDKTGFYQDLLKRSPEIFGDPVKAVLDETIPRRGRSRKHQSKFDVESDTPIEPTKSKTAPLRNRVLSQTLKKDDAYWRARAVWEIMLKAQAAQSADDDTLTIDDYARALRRQYELDNEVQAANYIRALAIQLVGLMQKKGRRRNIEWTDSKVYGELLTAKVPSTTAKKLLQLEMHPRKTVPVVLESTDEATSDASDTGDEVAESESAHRTKSALRPKGKFADKGAGKRGKSYTGPAQDIDDDGEADPDAMEISPSKRKAREDLAAPPSKRRVSKGHRIHEDEPLSPSDTDSDHKPNRLPLRWKKNGKEDPSVDGHPAQPFMPGIVKEPLPSHTPSDPGDVWECNLDGCNHKVYGASSQDGKGLVEEHIKHHSERSAEQIELVHFEAGRHFPYSRLIQRIREMAEQQ
ncbi:hypothetical protein K402DRAFT_316012, partial [Aulographum hederae CBS 113979]